MLDIMVVDDEIYILDAFKRQLKGKYNVYTAENAVNALKQIKALPDLAVVIADYRMPGLNGIDFISKAREIAPDTSYIMLSGYADQETILNAINKGNVFRFLTKPCNHEDLTTAIDEAIAENHFLKQAINQHDENIVCTIRSLLAALKEKDYLTEGHTKRVANYTRRIGIAMGLSASELRQLSYISYLHDIGKIGIGDEILYKKGPLNNEEWEIMKQHPLKGSKIASASLQLEEIADLILKHHEHWDGSGYPLGLEQEEIPLEARILAVSDAFDVMTSNRPYRKAMSRDQAFAELERCAGSQFDPQIVAIFIKEFKG